MKASNASHGGCVLAGTPAAIWPHHEGADEPACGRRHEVSEGCDARDFGREVKPLVEKQDHIIDLVRLSR